jgi:hypothetical protein
LSSKIIFDSKSTMLEVLLSILKIGVITYHYKSIESFLIVFAPQGLF